MGSKKSDKKKHRHKDKEEDDDRRKRDYKEDRHKDSKRRSENEEGSKGRSRSRRHHSSDDEASHSKRSRRSSSKEEEERASRRRGRRDRSASPDPPPPQPKREELVPAGRPPSPPAAVATRGGGDTPLSVQGTKKLRAELRSNLPTPPSGREGSQFKSRSDAELSVEETNKLRAELGLKPLDVGTAEEGVKTADVHVPAKNIGQESNTRKIQEKLQEMKQKRQTAKKLKSSKGLADEEDLSASSWVERMKRKEEEKRMAEQRARALEEMDEEFGVGGLIQDSIQDSKAKAYTSADLQGLKVEHDEAAFAEGQTVILTLKDSTVLGDQGDLLENVNILDQERAKRNVDLKKPSPAYQSYHDEFDETGMLKEKKILAKYEEEIEGIKKEPLVLGDQGRYSAEEQKEHRMVQQRLAAGAVSLAMGPATIAREYYTTDEMVTFKKTKKRKVKKTTLKADDLLSADRGNPAINTPKDHGRRGTRRHHDDDDDEENREQVAMETEDIKPLVIEEEQEEAWAQQRSKQLLGGGARGRGLGAEMVGKTMVPEVKEEPLYSSDAIVLDSTAEFCRQLGEDTVQAIARRTSEPSSQDVTEASEEPKGNWEEVTMETDSLPTEKDLYQDAEPVVSTGMMAALQMANLKGFIDDSDAAKEKRQRDLVERVDREDRGRDRERRERDRDMNTFPEKKDYNPLIKITYTDDVGRELQKKEAFREMSHKFHGKGSGRKKTEKRLKRRMEEFDLLGADTGDTPLNTLQLLQDRQRATSSAFVVVSGGQSSSVAALSKPK